MAMERVELVTFFDEVATRPGWWRVLLGINLVGSAYGFWWYRDQLLTTPVRYWPVVPDSPGATFLFTLFLAWLLRTPGARPGVTAGGPGLLAAVALASNMKYGLWTAIVLPHHALLAGTWTPPDVYLSLSHIGMWAQGLVYLRRWRPTVPAAAAALAWLLLQDFVDYRLLNTHPYLPDKALVPAAEAVAWALSLIWGSVVLWQAARAAGGGTPDGR